MIDRMCSDWDKMHPGMRKPWNVKDTTHIHALCGGYIHFKLLLKSKLPETEFKEVIARLDEQFLLGFLDADLDHALQSTVPPGCLSSVGFLRPRLVEKYVHC